MREPRKIWKLKLGAEKKYTDHGMFPELGGQIIYEFNSVLLEGDLTIHFSKSLRTKTSSQFQSSLEVYAIFL